MPTCPVCSEKRPASDLQGEGDQLACSNCRTPRLVLLPEVKMTSDPNTQKAPEKKLIEIQVHEVHTPDGGTDHQISMSVKMGSFFFQNSVTLDAVRKFFAERRRKAEVKAV